MKKVIVVLFFAALSGVVSAQETKPVITPEVDNKNAPDLKFEVEEYNFGTVKQGEVVTYDFNFISTGKEPLIISNAQATCGCTVPSWPKEPMKKGEKGTIKVSFNSTGKMRMQDKTVTITSNAKSGSKVLHIKGNVETVAPKTDGATEQKSK
jgi:LEA14-like dessication related protein